MEAMPMSKSTAPHKVSKPRTDFPLFPHQNGWWAKKVRGKLYYFGSDKTQALTRYLEEAAYLHLGKNQDSNQPEILFR